ncbi:glycosyltransferase family 4 protein [Paenibacillus abyssi]|uniref:Hexosyltransferase n=1 Tax=Paenibacillus abyssi TaxID=1340531 RepID=A0A917FNV1_9BACL|nr:glycosyltransferase family 4 protein [Paenibacillus abyssi]GGF92291.1 hexosyltransferase [Paenibacillus abyssi]
MKKKIAFVVQRYGLEVNGGSELSCRLIAEKLKEKYDIDILTTKALDYVTWGNHYEAGIEDINGVTVRRFETEFPRNQKQFSKCTEEIFRKANRTIYDELEWMKAQGPASFTLIDYLKNHNDQYDKVIFFTYLYFTTYFGLQQLPEKSILVPTAHDEPYIYFSLFKPFFHLPRNIVFLTEEEKNFVHRTFHNQYIPNEVAGLGIDVPESYFSEEEFREKFNVHDPFIIYVGRIDESKGCKELFEYFLNYKKQSDNNIKLVLIGKNVMDIPKHSDIIHLGFVSDEEKFGAIAASELLVMPSKYESFSMAVLEGMYLNKPVLVNGDCEVLVGHCNRGNAGLYYTDFDEFHYCLDLIVNNTNIAHALGTNGHQYVINNYSWNKIEELFIKAIESI